MRIYSFNDYRSFIKNYIETLPKKGRGEISRMAESLRIPQPLMSQILSGDKDLNLEQADLLSDYLQLTDNEKTYLFTLVQIEKSGRENLKKHFINERNRLKKEALDIQTVIVQDRKLTELEKSIFYSSWLYQAVRLLTSLDRKVPITLEEIAALLNHDRAHISNIMNFLVQTGLCKIEENGYRMGVSRTHLEKTSPHLPRHHTNWRMKSVQYSERLHEEDLMFTSPLTVSRKDFLKIREEILTLIKSVNTIVEPSPAEELACLNIDFFKLT